MTELPNDHRIIIVGAGPTGATLALLLARYGIASVLMERRQQPQSHPAASILNTRSMEIFRELGVEPEIMADCQEVFHRSYITWVTHLSGYQLGRLSAVQDDLDQQLSLSPTHAVHYPQHRLEPRLWEHVQENALVEFRSGARCVSVVPSESHVTATVENRHGVRDTVNGSYLVACDGADSALRGECGIDFPGPLLQNMIGVHFEADLSQLVNHRPSILYWLFHPHVLGVLIAHWLPTEWVLFFPYFPPQQSVGQFDELSICRKIRAAVGAEIPDLKLHKMQPWQMTARLATRYRHGRVFLAGDAAHTFPPTGGLGLNTGVQDAHNLAWKFAAVLHREARESLLDTYQSERRPVAIDNLAHSTDNYWKMSHMTQVVGLDLKQLDRLRNLQAARLFRALPAALQNGALEWALNRAMHRLRGLQETSQRGDHLRRRFSSHLPAQMPHYRSLGLDLGFVYQEGAIVHDAVPGDGTSYPRDVEAACSAAVMQRTRYESVLKSGGRLPHLPIQYQGRSMSTLDLVPRRGFVLLTTPAHRSDWDSALGSNCLPSQLMAVPAMVSIGSDDEADAFDRSGGWQRLLGDRWVGALVRPDGHIAWLPAAVPDQSPATLERLAAVESLPA